MRPFSSFRYLHWIALFAMLWASLWPSLGRAWVDHDTSRTITVDYCDATGHRLIAVELPGQPASHADHESGEHCPFCRMPDAVVTCLSAALPPSKQIFVLARTYEPPFQPQRVYLLAWSLASPRAPPRVA